MKRMNCPKCKNPVEENASICEWCGANCATKQINTKVKINYWVRKTLNIFIVFFLFAFSCATVIVSIQCIWELAIPYFGITILLTIGLIINKKWLKNNTITRCAIKNVN